MTAHGTGSGIPGIGSTPRRARKRRSTRQIGIRQSASVGVGCGLIMLALTWLGSYLSIKRHLERSRYVAAGDGIAPATPRIAAVGT